MFHARLKIDFLLWYPTLTDSIPVVQGHHEAEKQRSSEMFLPKYQRTKIYCQGQNAIQQPNSILVIRHSFLSISPA